LAPDTDRALPLPDEGTLILMEIAHLTGSRQSELVAWLDELNRSDAVQIVSTTSRQMVPLVESGEFRADLYYRLNVIRIDLAEPAADRIG
jgi:transcriptional regulator of aroF, aroG, tyrA and aromatic amino acid transport